MPKVSVIIPVYNVEKYLRECLDSVINQTLRDIEIICINDGSTDNSLTILKEYASKDDRIKILNQENKGAGSARNVAIDRATGQFVCFMDSDDYYPTDDILETLYNKAIENNVKICGGELAKFTNENPELKQNFGKNYLGFLFKDDGLIKYTDYQFDCGFYRFIYNRKFLIKNKIYSPEYRRFEDPPFFVNAMILAKEFYGIHKITYAYRMKHKVVFWSEENTIGALSGITDDFNYARKYKLNKLTEYTYARLKNHMKLFKDKKYPRKYLLILKIFLQEPYVRKKFIKNIIQGIFSVKNKNNHKIITIFGIKIKIRRKEKQGILHTSIPIIFSCDNNFAPHLCGAIASILINKKDGISPCIYIIDGGISPKNKKLIESLNRIAKFKIKYLTVKPATFKDFPLFVERISSSTYYRYLIADLLPELDKIIYLDCDLNVLSDLTELFNVDIDEYYLAGVKDIFHDENTKRLNISKYVNAGVLLLNLKKIRQNKKINELINYTINNADIIKWMDQDVINVVMQDGIKYIDMKWNAQVGNNKLCKILGFNDLGRKASIIHYIGHNKPWLLYSIDPFKDIYWKYLSHTPFGYLKFVNSLKYINDKIFSIRDTKNKKHKIITILGIKIKLKRK